MSAWTIIALSVVAAAAAMPQAKDDLPTLGPASGELNLSPPGDSEFDNRVPFEDVRLNEVDNQLPSDGSEGVQFQVADPARLTDDQLLQHMERLRGQQPDEQDEALMDEALEEMMQMVSEKDMVDMLQQETNEDTVRAVTAAVDRRVRRSAHGCRGDWALRPFCRYLLQLSRSFDSAFGSSGRYAQSGSSKLGSSGSIDSDSFSSSQSGSSQFGSSGSSQFGSSGSSQTGSSGSSQTGSSGSSQTGSSGSSQIGSSGSSQIGSSGSSQIGSSGSSQIGSSGSSQIGSSGSSQFGSSGSSQFGSSGSSQFGSSGSSQFGSSGSSQFGSSGSSQFGSSGPSQFGSSGPSQFGSSGPSEFGSSGPSQFGSSGSSQFGSSGSSQSGSSGERVSFSGVGGVGLEPSFSHDRCMPPVTHVMREAVEYLPSTVYNTQHLLLPTTHMLTMVETERYPQPVYVTVTSTLQLPDVTVTETVVQTQPKTVDINQVRHTDVDLHSTKLHIFTDTRDYFWTKTEYTPYLVTQTVYVTVNTPHEVSNEETKVVMRDVQTTVTVPHVVTHTSTTSLVTRVFSTTTVHQYRYVAVTPSAVTVTSTVLACY